MLSFVPLHLNPTAREERLKPWLNTVTEGMGFKWLSPEDWFTTAQRDQGNYIWDAAPAVGDVVYELIDKSHLKQPQSMHLVLIPRIATGRWRRIMTRRNDCYLKIDWFDLWPTHLHFEPLLMFISFPYVLESKFSRRQKRMLEQFQGILQECKLQETSHTQKGYLLRKLFSSATQLSSV